ncbi:MAG TPA: hypothetical protein VNZ01_13415 [Solirubrobacteraceae bacterium]|nr:hypothetical protein [Solirubrobacteraceae bacterium]
MTRVDPLARAVYALLVIACFAAFFVTQRLKHTPTVVQRFELTPRFSPFPGGHVKQEAISFRLANADAVTVTIIDANEEVVATLVRDRRLPRYKQFSLRWNGRRGTARHFRTLTTAAGHAVLVPVNEGRLAPAGEYRVKVTLREQSRKVLSPRSFTLVGG